MDPGSKSGRQTLLRGSLGPGTSQTQLRLKGTAVGSILCYEISRRVRAEVTELKATVVKLSVNTNRIGLRVRRFIGW